MVLQKSLVTIGTLPGCDLVLTDPTVSRATRGGGALRRLYAPRPRQYQRTFLDGVKVREAYLSPGSRHPPGTDRDDLLAAGRAHRYTAEQR